MTQNYLITGNSYAAGRQKLLIQKLSFNCRTQQILKSPKVKINSRIEIQSKLRALLKSVLPFALPRPFLLGPSASSQRALDLAVILDFSGSMRQDMPEILRQLRYTERNQSSESRLGIITMEEQDQVRALQMNRDWNLNIKILEPKKERGEVAFPALLKALGIAGRYQNWENKAMLLFFYRSSLIFSSCFTAFFPLAIS